LKSSKKKEIATLVADLNVPTPIAETLPPAEPGASLGDKLAGLKLGDVEAPDPVVDASASAPGTAEKAAA
jgi:hypothetical protein